MRTGLRPGRGLLGAVALLCFGVPLEAQLPTPAGTQISNVAQAIYVAPNGHTFTAVSNVLVVTVAQMAGVDLAPPRTTTANPGDRVAFAHTATNAGNGTDSVRVSATSAAGWPTLIYRDPNGNGVLDAGEPEIQGPVTLAAGAAIALLVVVDVPTSATVRGTVDSVTVVAVSEFDGSRSDSCVDVLQIQDVGVLVTLSKLVDRTTATAGDVLTYTVSYAAAGTNSADSLVVRDEVPLGTSYVAGSLRWNGAPLTDAAGDGGEFDPAGNRVLFSLGDVGGGSSGTVAFQARVDGGLGPATTVANTAGATYGTMVGTDSVVSNTVVTTIVLAQLGLAKTLIGPTVARIGEQVSYTLMSVNRSSTTPARDVVLSDTVPAGLEHVTANPAATVNGQVLSWSLGEVVPGDSIRVSLTVRVSTQVRDTLSVRNLAVLAATNAPTQTALSDGVDLVGLLPNQLSLEKTADVLEVGLGETAPYTLVLENTGDNALSGIVIVDTLPLGGRYAEGSAIGADSVQAGGRVVTFFVAGPLAPGATHTVRYTMAVVSADTPVLENRAMATAEGGFVSTTMQVAWVRVRRAWPMETRAVIGKAWLDLNDDGRQGAGERGVAGLDVWTDDGEVATTDADGKFSFRNVRPGGHALRIDPTTVPAGYRIAASDRIVPVDADGWTTPNVQFRLVPTTGRVEGARIPVPWSVAARVVSPPADTAPATLAVTAQMTHAVESTEATSPSVPVAVLPVTFAVGSAVLTSESHAVLDDVAGLLAASPEVEVEIAGHTSSTGPRLLNLRLSLERATSVTDYLIASGIDRSRLHVEAYGPDRPVASNDTPEGRARNRRVEMHLVRGTTAATAATFVRGLARAGLADSALVPSAPPAPRPPVTEYAVTITNPTDRSLDGLSLRFETPPDSATLAIGGAPVRVDPATMALPPVTPGANVVLTVWATASGDSTWVALQAPGHAGERMAVRVADLPVPAEGTIEVAGETANLPDPALVGTGRAVTLSVAPSTGGWPELTLPLPAGWEPVPGSTRLAGVPTPDPAERADSSGGTMLVWNFGKRAMGPITFEARPATRTAPEASVSIPALRSDADRLEDRRTAFLFGPSVEIFGLQDGAVTARDRVFIGVKGQAGQPVTLYDGDSVLARGNIRIDGIHDFIAIPLAPGPHVLRVAMRNTWSQERWDSISVHVSDVPARLVGPTGTLTLRADGQSVETVRVRMLDRWGVPVVFPSHATVTVDGAEAVGSDSDPSSVGLQHRSDSLGWLTVRIKPGHEVRRGRLALQTGDVRYERDVETLPATRPLMVTGVGRVGVGASPDAFGAITARGRLDDRTAVVVSVDSRRLDADRETFGRDFDPLDEAQYPILGDASSVRTVSASQHAVAARIERGFDWLAVGDVSTGDFAEGLSLAAYRRALSGGMARIATGPVSWRAFASVTSQSLEQEQIRGAGISGPYALGGAAIPGTEQIVVEMRDRENPQRVLTRQVLVRFIDYQIDYQAGTLLFKRPVPAADATHNPVFLMVTYEGRGGGDQRLVGGVRASLDALGWSGLHVDSLRLGVTAIHADEAGGAFDMTGVDVRLLRFNGFDLGGEVSYSHAPDSSGVATSLTGSVDLLGGAAKLSASWMRIGNGFGNPSNVALRGGTEEFKAGGTFRVGSTTLRAQHDFMASRSQDVSRRRTSLGVVQPVGKRLKLEATQTMDSFENGTDGDRSQALEGKLAWTPLDRLELWAEGRQQLGSSGSLVRPNHLGAGAGVKLTDDVRVELRHRRVLLPADESYGVTNIGLKSDLGFGTQAWGSYQLAGGAGAQYNAAIIGLNNRIAVGPSLTLNSIFERRFGLNDAEPGDPVRALPFLQDEEDYWSAGLGVEFLPQGAPYRVTARGEYRDGDRLSTRLVTLAGDLAVNRSLAVLSRQEVLSTEQTLATGTETGRRVASLWGVAFRPIGSDAVNVLTKFSWLDETNPRNRGVLTSLGQEQRLIGAAEVVWTPSRRIELAGRYALRRTEADRLHDDGVTQRLESTADYLGTRTSVILNPFLTFRADGRLLIERTSGTTRWDVAPALAVGLLDLLEVAVGYRFGDLRDPDFSVRGGHGVFLTLGTRVTEESVATVADFWRARFGN